MHPSRSMVLLTGIVGCTNGVLGEECSASGHSRGHEAAWHEPQPVAPWCICASLQAPRTGREAKPGQAVNLDVVNYAEESAAVRVVVALWTQVGYEARKVT
jgi:hypothetical protein